MRKVTSELFIQFEGETQEISMGALPPTIADEPASNDISWYGTNTAQAFIQFLRNNIKFLFARFDAHKHDGIDSPKISWNNVINRPF